MASMVENPSFYGASSEESIRMEEPFKDQGKQDHRVFGNDPSSSKAPTMEANGIDSTIDTTHDSFYDTMHEEHGDKPAQLSMEQNHKTRNEQNSKEVRVTGDGDKVRSTDHEENPGQESEYDVIAREAATILDKKLDNVRGWAKKLLREITVYVKTLEEVQSDYLRVQRLEHQEAQRLDQVEPDVQGATSHLLGRHFFGQSESEIDDMGYSVTGAASLGSKRKHDQA